MGQIRGLFIFLSGANKIIIKTADKYKKYFPRATVSEWTAGKNWQKIHGNIELIVAGAVFTLLYSVLYTSKTYDVLDCSSCQKVQKSESQCFSIYFLHILWI